jgi:phosphatidylserine/phosphatidylglycerophosphate/cardiolipin synthase-like enzyme
VLDFVRAPRRVPVQLVAGRGHYQAVMQAVEQASCSVWIATANLKEAQLEAARRPGQRGRGYRSSLALFDELAAKGVELRILHARLPSTAFQRAFDRHPRLVRGGLELRLCPRVHLKAVVVDGALLYLGSANWTGAGLGAKGSGRRNFEVGVVVEDPLLLDEVQAIYDRIWRGLECRACRLQCEAALGPRAHEIRRRS